MSSSRSVARLVRQIRSQSSSHCSASSSSSASTVAFTTASLPSRKTSVRTISTSASRSAPPTQASSDSSSSSAIASTSTFTTNRTPSAHLPNLARRDPALYAAVRPPPVATFAALASRLGLLPSGLDPATRDRRIRLVYQACTHPTFQSLLDKVRAQNVQQEETSPSGLIRKAPASLDSIQFLPDSLFSASQLTTNATDASEASSSAASIDHHATLATVGNSLLGMLATEFLHLRYPNLPTRVLKAAVAAYVGPSTLSDVGAELGLGAQGVLRWNKEARVPKPSNMIKRGRPSPINEQIETPLLSKDVTADAMRAIVALIFQEQGLSAARRFVINHLLNRQLNLQKLLKFNDPKRALTATCLKYGKELPQSRMIAESGRLSISPIFVVGVWSGATKVGEGSGSSIKMAEFRAAEDALRRLYLTETPLGDFDLPSTTLDATYPGVKSSQTLGTTTSSLSSTTASSTAYKPQPIGEVEVLEVAGKARH